MKTAILVISFGTSHRDTLEKTIGAVEKKNLNMNLKQMFSVHSQAV